MTKLVLLLEQDRCHYKCHIQKDVRMDADAYLESSQLRSEVTVKTKDKDLPCQYMTVVSIHDFLFVSFIIYSCHGRLEVAQ